MLPSETTESSSKPSSELFNNTEPDNEPQNVDSADTTLKSPSPVQLQRSTRAKSKPSTLNMNPSLQSYADVASSGIHSFNSLDVAAAYTEIADSSTFDFQHLSLVAKKTKNDPDIFTWDEAMASDDKADWKLAADKEIHELVD